MLEDRSRDYVEHRLRAGVLEQGTADLLRDAGVGERLDREGIVHGGIHLQFEGERHHVPMRELTGRSIVLYGQTEVVKDLIAARLDAGLPLLFEVEGVAVEEPESDRPRLRFRHEGRDEVLECDAIAGCDGFHGVCRASIPDGVLRTFERDYAFGWLGILAQVAPSIDELVYTHTERGFALLSLRGPELSRYYLQVDHDEDVDAWPDDRIWEELRRRTALEGWTLHEGPILEKGVTGMRSFVVEPMQHGNLFLAGDAAHIVPPTGAKGLNLAIQDVRVLAEGLVAWFRRGDRSLLDRYSRRLPSPRLALRALLLVDDEHAPPAAGRRPVRPQAAARAAPPRRHVRGRGDRARGELRRAGAGVSELFGPIFVPDALREAVSGRAWLAAMLEAERALAAARGIEGRFEASDYDLDALAREGRRRREPGRAARPRVAASTCRRRTSARPRRTSSTPPRCSSRATPAR